MARLVRHDDDGPLKLDESDIDATQGNVAVCLCGLSAEYPFCDGSHRSTRDEAEEELYRYEGDDDANTRHVVAGIIYADD